MRAITAVSKTMLDIRKDMARIRRFGGRVITNYFNQCDDLEFPLRCWIREKTLVFVWDDNGIKRIYFYSVDTEELSVMLARSESGCVIDFLTRDKTEYQELFYRAGYKLHLEYGRFYSQTRSAAAQKVYETLQQDDTIRKALYEAPYGEMAQVSDAEEIDRQLREQFDPYEAHFYSIEKLREHIRKGWVWVAKQDGKIVAANLYEIQGCKSYGAYLYNYAGVDVLGSLIAKVDAYIMKQFGVTYSYCWMRLSNKRIIRYNIKFNGYTPDGLYDMIYVKE